MQIMRDVRGLLLLVVLGIPLPAACEVAPDWRLSNPAGNETGYYADSRGHASVVFFWASWCPYCRALVPVLQELASDFAGRRVKFYALNLWEDEASDPAKYARNNGVPGTLLLKAEAVAKAYGVTGTPGLFAMDASHRIVYARPSGAEPVAVGDAIAAALTRALAK